jgi:hypothetical protein
VEFKSVVPSDDLRVKVCFRNSHFRQLTNSCWSLKTGIGLQEAFHFVDSMPWYYRYAVTRFLHRTIATYRGYGFAAS